MVSWECVPGGKGTVLGACSQGCGLDCGGGGGGREQEEREYVGSGGGCLLYSLLYLSPVVFLNTDLNIPRPCPENPTVVSFSAASSDFRFFTNAFLTLHLACSPWSCRAVRAAVSQPPCSPRLGSDPSSACFCTTPC